MTPAVVATGLVKEFEKGRYTLWQRLRREPDRRTRFRAVNGIDLRVSPVVDFHLLPLLSASGSVTRRLDGGTAVVVGKHEEGTALVAAIRAATAGGQGD